jgi:hypothetical protein
MRLCKYCNQQIEWRESKKTAKPYSLNADGSLHRCPNYNEFKNNDKNDGSGNIQTISEQSNLQVTTAAELLDEKNIENIRWLIDLVNLRLICKRIELAVKEKEGSSQ